MPLVYDPMTGSPQYQRGPLIADEFSQYLELLKQRKEDDRIRQETERQRQVKREDRDRFLQLLPLFEQYPDLSGGTGQPGAEQGPGAPPFLPGAAREETTQPPFLPQGAPPEQGEAPLPQPLAQLLQKRQEQATGVPDDIRQQSPLFGSEAPPEPAQSPGGAGAQAEDQPPGGVDPQKYIELLSQRAALGDENAQDLLDKIMTSEAGFGAAGTGKGVITRDLGDRIGIYDKVTGELIREEKKGGLTSQRLGDKLQYYDRWGNPVGDPVPFGVPPQQTVKHKASVASAEETAKMAARGHTPMSRGQEEIDKAFGKWYASNVIGGQDPVSKANNEISVLEDALDTDIKTGPFVGRLGWASLDPNTRAVRQEVEKVIQETLKETLGAQFTKTEGENLLARTFDPKAPVEKTKERIRRLVQLSKQRARNVGTAINYWTQNNSSLKGFEFEPLTIDEINEFVLGQDATKTPAQSPGAPAQGGDTPEVRKYERGPDGKLRRVK